MADVAALALDLDGRLPSPGPNPTGRAKTPNPESATGKAWHGVISYSYGVTSHEHKQAKLDAFHNLGDAYAPPPPPQKHVPADVAYYKLMQAYERGDASSRKASEAFADEYERQCQRQQTEKKATQTPPPPAEKKRNVCNSCLRPFDDDGDYKPAAGHGESEDNSSYSAPAASGVSFDVELGAWKVHFARNMQQEALHARIEETVAEEKVPEPLRAEVDDEYPDGGYVDYHSHLHGNSSTTMPVRTWKEDLQMAAPAVSWAAEKAATRDVMADYDAFLRGNHVAIMPAEKKSAEIEKPKTAAPAVYLAAQAAAAGDIMTDYVGFLWSNDGVVMPAETEAEKPAAAEVVQKDEDEDMEEYVDVMDEEYLDYLRSNHVVVDVVKKTEVEKVETAVTAKPVVNVKATRYEQFYEFGGNVGPCAATT